MKTPRELAADVVADITAAGLSLTPDDVDRGYAPQIELKTVDQLTIRVVPREKTQTRHDAIAWDRRTVIDVGIMQKLSGTFAGDVDNDTVDPLSDYADQLAALFSSEDYAAPDGFDVEQVDHNPLFVPDHFNELRQFTSVVSITFRRID